MPKYLIQASYTSEGAKGLRKDGGTARRAMMERRIQSAGGSLEAYYFAFGSDDLYLIVDMPSNVAEAAVSLNVWANGAARINTTVLLTAEEMDEAAKMASGFTSTRVE